MKAYFKTFILLIGFCLSTSAFSGGVYQQPDDFIKQVFNNTAPKAKILWLDKTLKKQIAEILDHKYKGLRIRYWQQNKRSVWVLEEVGKEKLITTGIVINNNKIEQIKVLIFRESRGWEIRHNFFTDQFKQLGIKKNNQLDKTIDNISGATLSVRAIKKLASIALLLDTKIQNKSNNNKND